MRNEQKNGNLASNAAKLARLAKGAMTGGMKGAAVAAAKNFAPQIIKAVVAILVVLLLLPSILFFALPSMLFQWPSVDDAGVAAMNDQSQYVNGLYERLEGFALEEAERIVDNLSGGYDDVVVNMNLGGISRNWITAICSVMHEQDIGRIDENAVRSLVKQNLDYSYTTETYEEDTGRTDDDGDPITETKTRIIIDIRTITPEELMDKLGFTDFQKEWARFLYDNINETQLVSSDDPEYPGGELVNYGDLVFTDGGRNVVYYNQADSRWGHCMYGNTHTIAVAGCGPTALAMVVSSMTDTMTDPKEMADWSYENGYCAEGNGSYHALIPDGAKHFGLSVTGAGIADGQKIIDALADGKLVVALMGLEKFAGGHRSCRRDGAPA